MTTASIAAKIHDILAEEAPHRPPNPQPQPGRPVMLPPSPPEPPVVKVLVDCDPAAANNVASMSCQSSDDPGLIFQARESRADDLGGAACPWATNTLTACFEPESGYREARRSLLASPPTRRPKLRVM